jgi:hypothetical protein
MSGNNGDSNPPPPPTACKDLQVITVLNSPNPAVLLTLKKGDCLTVKALTMGNQKVLAAFKDQEVAGSITDRSAPRFLSCIAKGFKYKATVLAIAGGRCDISIEYGTCK